MTGGLAFPMNGRQEKVGQLLSYDYIWLGCYPNIHFRITQHDAN
jgi:hypothetical protein